MSEGGEVSGRDGGLDREETGRSLGMAVHDLRNPCASISANLVYVLDSLPAGVDGEVNEALADCRTAVGDLNQQLEQLASVSRWLTGQPPIAVRDGSVQTTLSRFAESAGSDVEVEPLEADALTAHGGGGSLDQILKLILANARQHARNQPVLLRARREGQDPGTVVVEFIDCGPPLAPDLLAASRTFSGQHTLKQHAQGRYGNSMGLLAIHLACGAIGAELEIVPEGGRSCWRLRLKPVA